MSQGRASKAMLKLVSRAALRDMPMQRVNGNYLYEVGSQIHPLSDWKGGQTTLADAHIPVLVAEGALEPLITRTVFQLKASVQTGAQLLEHLRKIRVLADDADGDDYSKPLGVYEVYQVQNALKAFEAVLAAELALIPLFVVSPKGGFDMMDLCDNGHLCFPEDLVTKVPDAIDDAQQAMRCLAFELPTAAGFHLHRVNEAVLRAYFDAVTHGGKRPKSRSMGDFLKTLDTQGVGSPKVKAALTQLKDLHRNPLMHPEDRLETADEAINLYGAVRSVVGEMLKEVPASNLSSILSGALYPQS